MKNFFLSLLFFIFSINYLQAQPPINVVITGECFPVSGTFTYDGLFNGKNRYTRTAVIEGENVVFGIGFDNTKWILYANGDLIDDGFRNNAVPAGLMPPFTGWINTGCLDGTLTINQPLSINNSNDISKNLLIYPNPAVNFVTISMADQSAFDGIIIRDILGKTVFETLEKSISKSINVEHLNTGLFFATIFKDGNSCVVKLLKE